MGYSYYDYSYTTIYDLKRLAKKSTERLTKKGLILEPVHLVGNKIAKNWWGISWINNLEKYSDYSNRLPRGKKYLKSDCILDLKIKKGKINAIVQGSSSKPYEVCVNIEVLNKEKIEDIVKLCENKIESIEDLINGKFPDTLKEVFIGKNGLFPSPDEIKFDCSCPDYASLCKHIASVLYAIGAKFDTDPRLFFELRGIDVNQLIKKAVDNSIEKLLVEKNKSERVIAEEDIDRIFGI